MKQKEAFVALVAALVWAAAATVHARGAPAPATFAASFGCISVTLLPAAFVWRRALPVDGAAWGLLHGVGLAAFPLAVLGKLLFEKTHHRALGAVTFAFGAFVVVTAGVLAARHLQGESRWGRVPRVALAALASGSLLMTAVWFFAAVLPHPLRVAVVDFVIGATLLGLASRAPLAPLPAWTRPAALGGVVAASGGVLLFALNQDLRRHLAEAAPVATFVVRVILF